MSTFIAIYENGQIESKSTLEEIFNLPGKYKAFSIGTNENRKLNDPLGICYYKAIDKPSKLKIGNLEWINIKFVKNRFDLSIYDHSTEQIEIKISYKVGYYPEIIKEVLEFITIASKFPNLKTYKEYVDLKKENLRLTRELEILNKARQKI